MKKILLGLILLTCTAQAQSQGSFDQFKRPVEPAKPPAVPTPPQVWVERCQGDYVCPWQTVKVCDEYGQWVCVQVVEE